jgi:hypothetical protein
MISLILRPFYRNIFLTLKELGLILAKMFLSFT